MSICIIEALVWEPRCLSCMQQLALSKATAVQESSRVASLCPQTYRDKPKKLTAALERLQNSDSPAAPGKSRPSWSVFSIVCCV